MPFGTHPELKSGKRNNPVHLVGLLHLQRGNIFFGKMLDYQKKRYL